MIRSQCSTPLARGELFNNPARIRRSDRRTPDRFHPHSHFYDRRPDSGRKVAALAEWFNARTAWHGPVGVAPVGHYANITLDISARNFGIQEQTVFGKESQKVLPNSWSTYERFAGPYPADSGLPAIQPSCDVQTRDGAPGCWRPVSQGRCALSAQGPAASDVLFRVAASSRVPKRPAFNASFVFGACPGFARPIIPMNDLAGG
jgi:hypothetical protein